MHLCVWHLHCSLIDERMLQMLDRISEVQMAHSRTKTQAMHELLDKTGALKTDQASTIADTCTDDL